jgi:hypothetical protein
MRNVQLAVALMILGATAPALAATGLQGDYFPTSDFTGTATSRLDPLVDQTWTAGAPPVAGLPSGRFSVRWTGSVAVPMSATYTFYLTSGARLWVNGRPIVDAPATTGQVTMFVGQRYDVRIEVAAAAGGCHLGWSSALLDRQIVPGRWFSPPGPTDAIACATAAEGSTLTLACPTGQAISNVSFASYGTPGGACGAFIAGRCRSALSQSVVSAACNGKTSCSLVASNATFGDPCLFTVKQLFAQATCAQASGAPPPPPPPAASGMRVGTNFWNLGWGIWNDVFVAGATFAAGSNPWRQAFLDEASHYSVLRFMDFGQVNSSTERAWSDRTAPATPGQEKLAYEWMIDLCNRVGADLWVTVPHQANQDYSFQLATLINANLKPGLKVYVEWSNETWNGMFSQTQYALDQGKALGLDADPWTAAFKYHVYAAVRVFAQFDRVFGAGSARLVKVIAGQDGNTWLTGVHVKALADRSINPDGVKANAYAIAPYFGRDVNGAAPDVIAQLSANVQAEIAGVQQQVPVATGGGLSLISYEGGQHVLSSADLVNARPEMYTLYTQYLDGLAPSLKLFMHYVHNGAWSSGGAWGAERFVGEPLATAHKLRALFDWITRHR